MFSIFEQVLLMLLFAAIGFILCKTKLAEAGMAKILSTIVAFIFLPATIFKSFSTNATLAYISQKYPLMLVSIGVLTVVATATYFIAKAMDKQDYMRRLYHYSLTIANYAYLGYPLVSALYGEQALLDVLIFCLPMSLYTNILGYCSLTKQKITFKKLLNPPVLAALLGTAFGLLQIPLPNVVTTLIGNAAACMAPVCMLMTGMVISQYRLRDLLSDKKTYLIVALRLIVIPTVIALALHLLGLRFAVLPALIAYAVPCGMNTILFPRLIGEDCRPGASMLFLSTAACMATIPLLITLFQGAF